MIRLREGGDPQEPGESSTSNDVGLDDLDPAPLDQPSDSVESPFSLTSGNQSGGGLPHHPQVPGLVVLTHRLLYPEQIVRFKLTDGLHRQLPAPRPVDVYHQLLLWADQLPRTPYPLDNLLGSCRFVHVDLDGVEPLVRMLLDPRSYSFRRLVRMGRVAGSVGVGRDSVLVAAQKPPNGLPARLSVQVPQGHVQRPDGRHGGPLRPTTPPRRLVHPLPEQRPP